MKLYFGFLVKIVFLSSFVYSLPTYYQPKQSTVDKFVSLFHIESSTKCTVCKDITAFLHGVGYVGIGKHELELLVDYICKREHIETNRVCDSVVREFVGEVWNVFVDAFLQPTEICGWVLGDTCAHFVDYFSPWNISIPEKTKFVASPWNNGNSVSGKQFKVLQISDIHLDNDYLEGSKAICKEPLCCRKNDGPPGPGEPSAPKWGYNGYCDSNIAMVQNMFETLVANFSDVDYILWTGDVPPHNIWNQTKQDQINAIREATNLLVKYFPNKKVFPALGNHEGAPVNSFPPPFITGAASGQWLRDALADDWSQWLPEYTKETIKAGGYYTVLVEKGFRIISLNMNYGNSGNWWLWINSTDPAGQLQWLVKQLVKAEDNEEKVHIIGHIPPDGTLKWFSFNYFRIINRFKDTITGQFFGHTHHDEFRVFYDEKTFKEPINVAYISPSVTTYHYMNPGFRIYDIDGGNANSTWTVTDHHTYILDLAKVKQSGVPVWEYEYSAKAAYGLKSLSPTEWSNLVYRMVEDDDLFQILYRAFTKQYVRDTCTGPCKKNYLCSMNTAEGGGFHNYCADFLVTDAAMNFFPTWLLEVYNKC